MSVRYIFSERLVLADLIVLFLRHRMKGDRVYYNERNASACALFLSGLAGFDPMCPDFNKKDAEGLGLLYEMQDNIRFVIEAGLSEANNVPDWARYSMHFDLRGLLEYRIVFIESARAYAAEQGRDDCEFYVASTFLDREIASFYAAAKSIEVRFLPSFFGKMRLLFFPLWVWLRRFSRSSAPASFSPARPAVWVEYGLPGVFEHAFWRKYLEAGNYDAVYYLDRADTPLSPRITSRIETAGMQWIDLHDPELFKLSGLSIASCCSLLRKALCASGLSLSLRVLLWKHYLWHEAYYRVFSMMNVKLLSQHRDRAWQQPIQADAVAAAGGAMLGYHWSNLPYCMKDWFATAQHVFFVWGRNSAEALRKIGSPPRHILPSGMWLEEALPLPEGAGPRSVPGGYRLTVFDSDVSFDIWQSPRTLSEFYAGVLGLMERHADWSALLKCKFADAGTVARLPGGAELWKRMNRLMRDGRMLAADPHCSPLSAAKWGDLCVCYTLNSAGICGQLRGARAVHWDSVGLRYPLFDYPGQKVAFKDLGEMLKAVELAAAGEAAIGDLSPWRHLYEDLNDGKGARRIAQFISDYMRTAGTGAACPEALEKAVSLYRARNVASGPVWAGYEFWRD